MNSIYSDYSSYDTGPESLPCHTNIFINTNNNNSKSFQSKYLFFNGLAATLPRKPKQNPNEGNNNNDKSQIVLNANLDHNQTKQGSQNQMMVAKNMCLPSFDVTNNALSSYATTWASQAESQYHSLTLPRHPRRLQKPAKYWQQNRQNLDTTQSQSNRVRLLVQSFESQSQIGSKEPCNVNHHHQPAQPPFRFRTMERERHREMRVSQDESKAEAELCPSPPTQVLIAGGQCKKIPPKVAPKPRKHSNYRLIHLKYVTDILISASNDSRAPVDTRHCQQYLSLDCLNSTSDNSNYGPPGECVESVCSPHSRTSSLSGHHSSSSSSGHHSSSSLSGHNSRSSTVSSSASIGGLFESKSCDSLLEPDTDVEDGGGVVTLMGHDDGIKTTRDQDPALTDTHGSRNSPDDTRSGQTTPSSSSQFPRSIYNMSSRLSEMSRCQVVRDILGLHPTNTAGAADTGDNYENNYAMFDISNNDDHKMIRGNVPRDNYLRNDFLSINRMKFDIAHKLDLMRTKESWLKTEIQETLRALKRLEDKMRIVARTYEVDKLKLHIQEIEKIISLIVSLTYRLIPVDNSLANIDWNGVEERYDLERRRAKLLEQIEEARLLWRSIKRRTGLVAGYIQQNLPFQDVLSFHQSMSRRVEEILQLKELQEKIKETELKLKTAKN